MHLFAIIAAILAASPFVLMFAALAFDVFFGRGEK